MKKELVKELKSRKEELEYQLHNDAFRTLKEIKRITGELRSINNSIKMQDEGK